MQRHNSDHLCGHCGDIWWVFTIAGTQMLLSEPAPAGEGCVFFWENGNKAVAKSHF